jgi:hypothetical protein
MAAPAAPCDSTALTAARALVESACPCLQALKHGPYVRCAAHTVNDAVKAGTVSRSCKKLLRKAAAKSICGHKVGAVTCCRTNKSGKTVCSIKSSAASCTAPRGGTSCASSRSSCIDACTATGCASPSGAFVDASLSLF